MSDKKMLLRQSEAGAEFWTGLSLLQPRVMRLAIAAVCVFAGLGILRVVLT